MVSVAIRVARCPVFDRTVRFFGDLSGQKYDAKPGVTKHRTAYTARTALLADANGG